MPSSASGPRRATSRRRPSWRTSIRDSSSNGRRKSAWARRSSRSARAAGQRSAGASRSARPSEPGRPWASSKSSRSERPPSGLRRKAASERSSAGVAAKRSAATRSRTASSPPILSTSAPATGTARPLQRADHRVEDRAAPLHQHHDVAGPDRASGAGQDAAGVEPAADPVGDRAGEPPDRVAGRRRPRAGRPSRSPRACRASAGTARARRGPAARARWRDGRPAAPMPSPARSPNTASTRARIGGAERKE